MRDPEEVRRAQHPGPAIFALLLVASAVAAPASAQAAAGAPGESEDPARERPPVLEGLLARAGLEPSLLAPVLALADESGRLRYVTEKLGHQPSRLFAAAFLATAPSDPARGDAHLPVVADLAVALELLRAPPGEEGNSRVPVSLPVSAYVPSAASLASAERLPVALRAPLASLLAGLVDADRWVRLAWRRVPEGVARRAASCGDGVAEALDPGVFPAALDDAAAALDRPAMAFAAVKALASLQRGADELQNAISRVPAGELATLSWEVDTPKGGIRLTGTGPDLHEERVTRGLLLAVDLGGDDTWRGGAAAHWPDRPVSALLDLGGNDAYDGGSIPGQGSGCGGVGVLWDAGGNDRHRLAGAGQAFGFLGAGVVVDGAGDDLYVSGRGGQASAVHGWALLLDRAGTDRYETVGDGQGFAGPGGFSLLADLAGNDSYESVADPARAGRPDPRSDGRATVSNAQGASVGRRGDLSDGHAVEGGTGALVDLSGDDAFRCGTWCQGAGYFGGTGILLDGAGDDLHEAVWYAAGSAAHTGRGALVDVAGNDRHLLTGTAGAGLGLAWDRAYGLFLDVSGDDTYRARRLALGSAARRSVAVFVDRAGRDVYEAASPAECLGTVDDDDAWTHRNPLEPWWHEMPQAGLFVDLGGRDVYPEGRAGEDRIWGTWDLPTPLLGPRNAGAGADAEGGSLPPALERLGPTK